jgi:regulator of protease activity HflC (stomatin/prohibitin superfamily)
MGTFIVILLAIVAIFLLSLVLGSFFTVSTAQVAVITRFGKFLRVAEPGLNWKSRISIPWPAW